MHTQREAAFVAVAEGVVGHKLRQGELAQQLEDVGHSHGAKPFALIADFGKLGLENRIELLHIFLAVVENLLMSEGRT